MIGLKGSGGITIRGDNVEGFTTHDMDIPLDGVAGVSGSVRVRFLWHPQLLANKKSYTSAALGDSNIYTSSGNNEPLPRSSMSSIESESGVMPNIHSQISSSLSTDVLSIGRSRASSINTTGSAGEIVDFASDSNTKGKNGTITVKLVEARGIRGVDRSGTSDPFVRVRIDKHQVYKTRVIKKTLRPEW